MSDVNMHDLIVDIHALDRELQKFEEKYTVFSEDFYAIYQSGKLRDENVEEIDEYGRWAALYRMRLRRKQQYDQNKSDWLDSSKRGEQISLIPHAHAEAA